MSAFTIKKLPGKSIPGVLIGKMFLSTKALSSDYASDFSDLLLLEFFKVKISF